jgi:glycogen debranching enzyme GlgX/4-alpha-glucanotransferase
MPPGPVTAGAPEPLGATPVAGGLNVAVLSTTATAIDLCLFDPDGGERRIRLPARTGEVFHGHVAGVGEGALYGLRAHGPFAPERGMRFDPFKLLVDPYAAAVDRTFALHPSLFAPPQAGLDTATHVPRGVVMVPAPARSPALIHPWERTIVYEAHVRGLTMRHPAVPEAIRGTFAALGHPAILEHLTRLGVTTLELLPTAAWIDERHLPPLGLSDYWGYNPVAFCAPDPRLAPGGWEEVRTAVEALAQAGIETLLDVVYNHTGEGDELGPTVSLRGLDNAGYYRLRTDDPALYVNDAGTGNILACDRLQSVRLVTEAMRAWARRGGVAGFRFDLASVLARRGDGFDPDAPLLAAIEADPELRGLKLIAEPWDCGPGGHQLGRFPSRWGEWNDRFRDTVRGAWRGAGVPLGELAARLAGSQDLFGARHRPSRSVNFVTAHDGFTLADVVSYAGKHNQANGEDNRDGSSHETAWNNGVEGPTEAAEILARRAGDQRALLTLLLAARGTPMLSMGAELGQTQQGNNNAYAQDNALSWLDWDAPDAGLAAFTARLCETRRTHPALHADRFLTGEAATGPLADVEWRRADGAPLSSWDWEDPAGATLQMVLAAPDAANDGSPGRAALLLNRGEAPADFVLPDPRGGMAWSVAADSADATRTGAPNNAGISLAGRSVGLLVETAEPGRKPADATDETVDRLADMAGIASEWWNLDGERRAVSRDSKLALLAAMDLPAVTRDDARDSLWRLHAPARGLLPPCIVAREGEPVRLRVGGPQAWLVLESDGQSLPLRIDGGEAVAPALAAGRYRLRAGPDEGALIVAPRSGHEPDALAAGERLFGLSAQLYGVRRAGDQGVGDFTTLGLLGRLAQQNRAGLLAINPLHALFPQDRERASPYYPSDRRFLEPLYLDVAGFGGAAAEGGERIDYPAVWAAKQAALAGIAEFSRRDETRADFEAFVRDGGTSLAEHCAFQVIAETQAGRPWRDWPQDLQSPAAAGVAAFVAARPERLAHHQALQWLCDRQFAAAAAQAPGLGLCRDLAVGAAPDGAEAWAAGERLSHQASIGAPPDAFAPQGQVWGLPPPDPHRWRAEAYQSFSQLLAANMRHAGALRIDHVLGLARLFWVPQGADGVEGAYVRYPLSDLLGVVALESRRARCLVIGEDLGTVPDGLRQALSEAGVYRYSVLPFEREGAGYTPPAAYPAHSLACASTHDLPPLEGWWAGADLDERIELGLLSPDAAAPARRERRDDKAALIAALAAEGLDQGWSPDAAFDDALAAAVHAFVARTPSRLMLAQVEDLGGETIGVNLPGTDRERPNWRRRMALGVEQLAAHPRLRAVLDAVRQVRSAP